MQRLRVPQRAVRGRAGEIDQRREPVREKAARDLRARGPRDFGMRGFGVGQHPGDQAEMDVRVDQPGREEHAATVDHAPRAMHRRVRPHRHDRLAVDLDGRVGDRLRELRRDDGHVLDAHADRRAAFDWSARRQRGERERECSQGWITAVVV